MCPRRRRRRRGHRRAVGLAGGGAEVLHQRHLVLAAKVHKLDVLDLRRDDGMGGFFTCSRSLLQFSVNSVYTEKNTAMTIGWDHFKFHSHCPE